LTPTTSEIKTDRHDIVEILLKVALNTINLNQTVLIHQQSLVASVLIVKNCDDPTISLVVGVNPQYAIEILLHFVYVFVTFL
jgi:hypothetical protein